jgi:hypothetical protein
MGFAFNPLQWVQNLLHRDAPDSPPDDSESADQRHGDWPPAQPFFLCPSSGYSREQTPDGRYLCEPCAEEFSPEDFSCLAQARRWLNDETRTLRLKDLMSLADDREAIRALMRPLFDGLLIIDQKSLKSELDSAGFPGINTLDMLTHWASKRLNDRVRRETLTAMYGPPVYIVRGGLPGLGK